MCVREAVFAGDPVSLAHDNMFVGILYVLDKCHIRGLNIKHQHAYGYEIKKTHNKLLSANYGWGKRLNTVCHLFEYQSNKKANWWNTFEIRFEINNSYQIKIVG